MTVQRGREHRLFLELSGGVGLSEDPETQDRIYPSGTLGVSVELGTHTSGLFLTGGLTDLRIERWTAMPHAGLGFFL